MAEAVGFFMTVSAIVSHFNNVKHKKKQVQSKKYLFIYLFNYPLYFIYLCIFYTIITNLCVFHSFYIKKLTMIFLPISHINYVSEKSLKK